MSTKREITPNGKPEHGEEVPPYRVIGENGALVCPDNKDKYTGDNQPWRR